MGVHEGKRLGEWAVLWHLCQRRGSERLRHRSEPLINVPLVRNSTSCRVRLLPAPAPEGGTQGGRAHKLISRSDLIKQNCRFDLRLPLRRTLLILFLLLEDGIDSCKRGAGAASSASLSSCVRCRYPGRLSRHTVCPLAVVGTRLLGRRCSITPRLLEKTFVPWHGARVCRKHRRWGQEVSGRTEKDLGSSEAEMGHTQVQGYSCQNPTAPTSPSLAEWHWEKPQ